MLRQKKTVYNLKIITTLNLLPIKILSTFVNRVNFHKADLC